MFCPRCHERIAENWSFCPRCGARLASTTGPSGPTNQTAFTEMFKDIQKQLEEALNDQIDGNIEFVDLKPEFIKKNPMFRTGGFRVKITRSGEGPPSIDIKAFGDVDEKLAEKMTEAIRAKAEAEKKQDRNINLLKDFRSRMSGFRVTGHR
ncbi:MAG: zinc ribbon domain-containing protein [Theionarchaea archaeon]|nr:zinc ribbon domain-containing protein [Theionarchaea archaeon]